MNLVKDPIPGLVRSIAIPASVGMIFQTLFNFVDTYFAGMISVQALAALTFSFPVFFIVLAFANGLGQAATALMANAVGAGHPEKSRRIFCQTLLFAGVMSVLLTIAGLILSPMLFRLQGAKESDQTLQLSLSFMNVIMAGSVFFMLQTVLNAELNSHGNTKVYRNTLIVACFVNIALDPWFMFGGFGLPAMGVAGLALATVVCQVGTCLYMMWHIRSADDWQKMSKSDLKPDWQVLRQIAAQAMPASFNMMTVGVGIFVIQYYIARFSNEAVSAYGVATRIEQFLLLPTMGLNYAVLSLVGQNNGAGRLDRVKETWHTTLKYGITMTVIGGVLLWFFKTPLMSIFTKDQEVIARGSDYLGIASITLSAYVILFQTVFLLQGLKRATFTIWIGLYRQIVAPLLVFHLLAMIFGWGLWGVWWGITLVTWSAAFVTLAFGIWAMRHTGDLPPETTTDLSPPDETAIV